MIAADTTPLEIVLHLPLLCEDKVSKFMKLIMKNIPYVFVRSKVDLGRMCGTSRNVVACSIVKNKNSHLNEKIKKIQGLCDRL